jgi:hypothetical protein
MSRSGGGDGAAALGFLPDAAAAERLTVTKTKKKEKANEITRTPSAIGDVSSAGRLQRPTDGFFGDPDQVFGLFIVQEGVAASIRKKVHPAPFVRRTPLGCVCPSAIPTAKNVWSANRESMR